MNLKSNQMQFIQIVPSLPPAISGVGDYAYLLAKQMRETKGIQTIFIVCDPTWKNAEKLVIRATYFA